MRNVQIHTGKWNHLDSRHEKCQWMRIFMNIITQQVNWDFALFIYVFIYLFMYFKKCSAVFTSVWMIKFLTRICQKFPCCCCKLCWGVKGRDAGHRHSHLMECRDLTPPPYFCQRKNSFLVGQKLDSPVQLSAQFLFKLFFTAKVREITDSLVISVNSLLWYLGRG